MIAPIAPAPALRAFTVRRGAMESVQAAPLRLQQPQFPERAAQLLRQLARSRAAEVVRRVLGREIAPALERPHRPRRALHALAAEPQPASPDPVSVDERLDFLDPLPRRELALDDPVQRAALDDLFPPGRDH